MDENPPEVALAFAFLFIISEIKPLISEPYFLSVSFIFGKLDSMLMIFGSPAKTPHTIGPITLFKNSFPNLLLTKLSTVSSYRCGFTNGSFSMFSLVFVLKKLLSRSFAGLLGTSHNLPDENMNFLFALSLLCITSLSKLLSSISLFISLLFDKNPFGPVSIRYPFVFTDKAFPPILFFSIRLTL